MDPPHVHFPLQQEALPDETEVIEDPTTEVGASVPPPHPSPQHPLLWKERLQSSGEPWGAALPLRSWGCAPTAEIPTSSAGARGS